MQIMLIMWMKSCMKNKILIYFKKKDQDDRNKGVLMAEFIDNQLYEQYLSALICGKRQNCYEIVKHTKNRMNSLTDLYTQLFQKSLYEVGRLWEYNQISVAVEHVATAITEYLMNNVYADIEQPSDTGQRAIIASVPNEYHQIGAKMVADLFELNGWETWFLGANAPTLELLRLAKDIKPHVIGLSLSVYFHISELTAMIQTIQKNIEKCSIIIGGQAFVHGSGTEFACKFSNIHYIESLSQLEKFIKTIETKE